ncbi:vitamin K epoxide reductase family protein [uncultured Amnibacterium sp.]|uniref:vitamin K epoxide reductase family protein n=1 Tax=uncultured Amnibacterium sp. TaxID=1631851 RepID=UPI0035CB4F00
MIERMPRPSLPLAILLVVTGIVGLIAAFALTLDKIAVLENPSAQLSCNFSVLIGCSKNLTSPVGSAFGFPNPLLGLMMFPAPLIVGIASIAGVRFPRWFWAAFNVGFAFAIGFVIYLISNSIFNFDLRVLCPWCMTVWSVVIPSSLAVTLYNLREQNLPLGGRVARVAGGLYGWMPILTLVCYLIFAVVAQINLDVLGNLF